MNYFIPGYKVVLWPLFLDITSELWMLAIDPGTSIVNTGDSILLKVGDATEWYQSIVTLGLDKNP